MRGGFLQLVLNSHVRVIPGRAGIGGHQPPGGHFAPAKVAPDVAGKAKQGARRARQRDPQTGKERSARAALARHARAGEAPYHPRGHDEGQHHKAHHMGAHHREADAKGKRQLTHIAFPTSARLNPRKAEHGPQQRENTPDIARRALHGKKQIGYQIKQHHAQKHPALPAPAQRDQQRQIRRRHIEREQPQAGEHGLIVGIAHLAAGVEQAVAHIQLQRGEMAVATEMALGFLFLQKLAQVAILAVALGQGQVFARVAAAHAIHAA